MKHIWKVKVYVGYTMEVRCEIYFKNELKAEDCADKYREKSDQVFVQKVPLND